ncbi:hypothetical protein SPSYN_01548 [Sporotomaculum syntrophicum]|uniref:Uncharacterized protein n=1 Tax=Sporotomaculum syntrophicum TaxID=182264 RepID=A0A9D3AZ19_9FIRM|nr:hypothetical protein [Sporotomaculum syntrophicum]KAF1085409.1 hypothetical protein SPSYN_01548 [Sporotomaculum syntrophicum]
MHDEQKDLTGIAEQINGEQEIPFFSTEWLNVLETDYIDAYDEAIDVLEDSPKINSADTHKKYRYPGYID